MTWFQRHKTDEHNTPTEPLPHLAPMQALPPIANGEPSPDEVTEPYHGPTQGWISSPPQQQGYPYLPQRQPHLDERRPHPRTSRRTRARRSVLPALVGFFFVLVQFLLLARFVISLLNVDETITWAGLIYSISGFFVWPFASLWQQYVPGQWPENLEVYTLVAVLVYGIASRILVRILKFLLNH